MALEQHENAAEQLTEGKMVGDDNSRVMKTRSSRLSGEPNKIFHIEGQNDSPLACGKRKLLDIRVAEVLSVFRREAINPTFSQNVGQERINILIEIEFDGHWLDERRLAIKRDAVFARGLHDSPQSPGRSPTDCHSSRQVRRGPEQE